MNKYLVVIQDLDNEQLTAFIIKTKQNTFENRVELEKFSLNKLKEEFGEELEIDDINISFYEFDEDFYEVIDLTKEQTNE